ncbi:hypothetical protein PINS_up009291 [Pythium insidiosum]|nr:hypothetical protein PINS_up009291 [Pythium insidiosum]
METAPTAAAPTDAVTTKQGDRRRQSNRPRRGNKAKSDVSEPESSPAEPLQEPKARNKTGVKSPNPTDKKVWKAVQKTPPAPKDTPASKASSDDSASKADEISPAADDNAAPEGKKPTKAKKEKTKQPPAPHVELKIPDIVVKWQETAWYKHSGGDLELCHTLVTRAHSAMDASVLEDDALADRYCGLYALLNRIKAELASHRKSGIDNDDDDNEEGDDDETESEPVRETATALRTVSAIVDDLLQELAGDLFATTSLLRSIEHEVIELGTELVSSQATVDDCAALERWATFLKSAEDGQKRQPPPIRRRGKGSHLPVTPACERLQILLAMLRARNGETGSVARSLPDAEPELTRNWDQEIERIYIAKRVETHEEVNRRRVADDISEIFARHHLGRGARLMLFGSSLSKFGSKTSDLDLCLRSRPTVSGVNVASIDGEELAPTTSVPRLSARAIRLHQRRRALEQAPSEGASNDQDMAFLRRVLSAGEMEMFVLLDKVQKAATAQRNVMEKLVKKGKPGNAAKLGKLAVFLAHLHALIDVLQERCGKLRADAGDRAATMTTLTTDASSTSELDDEQVAALIAEQRQRQKAIFTAAAVLGRKGCDVHSVIAMARVPVIRFTHLRSGLECDLCFDNYLGCVNTQLLRAYATLDERCRALGIAVKYWAKQRGISDASLGYLSSYSFILLVVYFLQVKAQLLPSLQHPSLQATVPPARQFRYKGIDVSFCQNEDVARRFLHENPIEHPRWTPTHKCSTVAELSVGALLFGFFSFYADEFDFAQSVVSVRQPERVWTKQTRWADGAREPWRMSIEDPLELDRDLGCVLLLDGQRRIQEEFQRAMKLMQQGESFDNVCEAVEVEEEEETEEKEDMKGKKANDVKNLTSTKSRRSKTRRWILSRQPRKKERRAVSHLTRRVMECMQTKRSVQRSQREAKATTSTNEQRKGNCDSSDRTSLFKKRTNRFGPRRPVVVDQSTMPSLLVLRSPTNGTEQTAEPMEPLHPKTAPSRARHERKSESRRDKKPKPSHSRRPPPTPVARGGHPQSSPPSAPVE